MRYKKFSLALIAVATITVILAFTNQPRVADAKKPHPTPTTAPTNVPTATPTQSASRSAQIL